MMKCPYIDTGVLKDDVLEDYYDVKWMIAAHLVHIVLHFIKKSLSKKDDVSYYL